MSSRMLGTIIPYVMAAQYMGGIGVAKVSPRVSEKVQRNVICNCGCGKKAKKCTNNK